MKHSITKYPVYGIGVATLALLLLLPPLAFSDQEMEKKIQTGYFSREGNDGAAARTTQTSIYIKFYPDSWVALLYVPYPYSTTLQAGILSGVFEEIWRQAKSNSFIRSKFGLLDEPAIVHLETWRMEGDTFLFDCGGRMPCVVEFSDQSMNMIKKGIIGEHIIKFNRVVD